MPAPRRRYAGFGPRFFALNLACCLLSAGSPATAAEPASPTSWRARVVAAVPEEALSRHQRGELAGALAEIDRVLAQPADEPAARYFRATVLARMGRLEEAAKDLQAVIAREPTWPDPEIALGDLHLREGAYAAALAHFRRARELDPENGVAYFLSWLCLALEGRAEEAEALRKGAQQSRRNPAFYFIHAARAFQQGEHEQGRYLLAAGRRLYADQDLSSYLLPFAVLGWAEVE
jgi:tetratricopeptide (TPR) repeat protein